MPDASPTDDAFLDAFLRAHAGVAGSIHRLVVGELALSASKNLPPPVVEAVRRVPIGRGMAGQAAATGAPFQTCALKADPSADVRPGARTVAAQAAVALPVLDVAGAVRAVVGIAFAREGEIAAPELARLRAAAERLP